MSQSNTTVTCMTWNGQVAVVEVCGTWMSMYLNSRDSTVNWHKQQIKGIRMLYQGQQRKSCFFCHNLKSNALWGRSNAVWGPNKCSVRQIKCSVRQIKSRSSFSACHASAMEGMRWYLHSVGWLPYMTLMPPLFNCRKESLRAQSTLMRQQWGVRFHPGNRRGPFTSTRQVFWGRLRGQVFFRFDKPLELNSDLPIYSLQCSNTSSVACLFLSLFCVCGSMFICLYISCRSYLFISNHM